MQMVQLIAEYIDVAEIHSPPSVAKRAAHWGFKCGWSIDLTTTDTDGKAQGITNARTDYLRMGCGDAEKAHVMMAMVEHGGGGASAYPTPGKGTQGDRHWLPNRMANAMGNCWVNDARVQMTSDHGPLLVVLPKGMGGLRCDGRV